MLDSLFSFHKQSTVEFPALKVIVVQKYAKRRQNPKQENKCCILHVSFLLQKTIVITNILIL